MDTRASPPRQFAVDDAGRLLGATPAPRASRTIDGADRGHPVDWTSLARNLSDRLDAVLGAATAADRDDPADARRREEAIQAWSSVVAHGASRGAAERRRQALSTTVLRIGSNGLLDVVDDEDRRTPCLRDGAPSREEHFDVPRVAARPDRVGAASLHADDGVVALRRKLEQRRATASAQQGRRLPPSWRRIDVRRAAWRVLVGATIVGASALASVLVSRGVGLS